VNIPLPGNQWTIEVSNWFNIALARLQHSLLEYATGPPDWQYKPEDRLNFSTPIYANTCSLQKVRRLNFSQDHMTLSFLGLIIVVSVGSFLIALGLVLEYSIGRLPSRLWGTERQAWVLQDRFAVWKRSRQEDNGRNGGSLSPD